MAFSYTILRRTVIGNMRLVVGTYVNGTTDTGGAINTGLRTVEFFTAQPIGSSAGSSVAVVNGSFPIHGGVVTIVTEANEDGVWLAIGQ